jgi:predicted O-linked N-acetylglucosamine transferase (SPINDLY family)
MSDAANRQERRRQQKLSKVPAAATPSAERGLAAAIEHHRAGRLAQAEAMYRQVLERRPDQPVASRLLASLQQGRTPTVESAAASFERGIALQRNGRQQEAIACFDAALAANWDFPEAHNARGMALVAAGRRADAVASFRVAIALRPGFAWARHNLGSLLGQLGEHEEAVACFRHIAVAMPDSAEAHNDLGNALSDLGKGREAIASYRRVVALKPAFAEAHYNLGSALKHENLLTEAVSCFRRALELNPDHAAAYNNLGSTLREAGDVAAAIACFEQAERLLPRSVVACSNRLLALHYDPRSTPASILDAHRDFDRRFGMPPPARHDNEPDPDRRIRIGYVSADLRAHPVGYFLSPVLPAHDRHRVEVFCYADSRTADPLTFRLQAASDVWRVTAGLGHDELARQVRADRIDVLVDLAGHTARNRLPMFAERPAPVQVTWAGYVGTTGLRAIGYLLSDACETPADADRFHVETVMRLPDGYVCYAPPDDAPAVAPLPAAKRGTVTFGCFNNLAKIGPGVLALWSRILAALPGARLVLKTHALGDPGTASRYRDLAAAAGIAGERLVLRGASPHRELLAAYGEVDIALDPFPYSGGLTTLESLWMGVPVVTLGGDGFAARHSQSHLTNAGLTTLIAGGADAYVEIAVGLARDLKHLALLRAELRPRVAASPLCDGPRFTRHLEAAYRVMWRRWCDRVAI